MLDLHRYVNTNSSSNIHEISKMHFFSLFAELDKQVVKYNQGCTSPSPDGCQYSKQFGVVDCHCSHKNCNTKEMIENWMKNNLLDLIQGNIGRYLIPYTQTTVGVNWSALFCCCFQVKIATPLK